SRGSLLGALTLGSWGQLLCGDFSPPKQMAFSPLTEGGHCLCALVSLRERFHEFFRFRCLHSHSLCCLSWSNFNSIVPLFILASSLESHLSAALHKTPPSVISPGCCGQGGVLAFTLHPSSGTSARPPTAQALPYPDAE